MTRFWILSRVQMCIKHGPRAPEVWTLVQCGMSIPWGQRLALLGDQWVLWASVRKIVSEPLFLMGPNIPFLQLSILSLMASFNERYSGVIFAHVFLVAFVINIREIWFICNSSRRCAPHRASKHSYIYYTLMCAKHSARYLTDIISFHPLNSTLS